MVVRWRVEGGLHISFLTSQIVMVSLICGKYFDGGEGFQKSSYLEDWINGVIGMDLCVLLMSEIPKLSNNN